MRLSRVACALLVLAPTMLASTTCGRRHGATPEQMTARIQALEKERDELRSRIGDLMTKDRRLEGMPTNGVRVGVPTSLVRMLVERVVGGFVDQVTLTLTNLNVHRAGKIKKVISIGEYDLDVRINEVTGRLKTGKPHVRFGGNRVSIGLPVQVVSGTGNATIVFKWEGKNVSGALCGDLEVTREVAGSVKPDQYPVEGSLLLSATAQRILATPRFPVIEINLKVVPSPESWASVQKILDDKTGVCGFVLDKANIPGVLDGLIGKGFKVKLPTEKLKPMAVPVGIAPTMMVRGQPVTVGVKVGQLAITEHVIWLGADVTIGKGARLSPPTK
jgi:hypothetical protein